MDYRQLRAFIAVFEARNITVAAQRIHLSQPALSASIKLLEDALGTPLFVRQARGVEVTEDARALYPQARRMVADVDSLARQFREKRHRVLLQVGVEQDIARCYVQALIRGASQVVPGVLLGLLEGCEGDARLASEELRCEDELFLPLWSEPYVLALPMDFSLAEGESTVDPALEQAAWITCPGHASHQRLLPLYGAGAITPEAQAGSFRLALALVAAGQGIAVVPKSLAEEQPEILVRSLPMLDLKRRIGLCYSAQALDNPALVQLRDAMR
ncbi:LysR family transcriptional regulator [Pseudomonas sp. FFUP_PS_473]|uniref:LysR family transcriptional regulator n=1 Tax=Pseudomonas sp. FFUP_PS_473 TaxID=2060418 RepID=UPI000C7A17EB|nr:LysR family transcriptional regulator [Pseudomonas sp. FFUP_PS_473]PLP89523.1 LysR family transcriptional regulator [Pseudomonas sp. FFUP_PS_473]